MRELLQMWSCLCITILILLVTNGASYMVDNNPYRQAEVLDREGKYYLEWLVNRSTKRTTFSVTVKTTGYVGLGLSRDGKMSGADIVIGGVDRNGHTYFGDRHAVGNHLPEMDPKQNWKLLAAWENGSHTHLRFSRPFDTCDDQDYVITDARIALIWAYGEKDDDFEYHHQNRGVFNVHLLYPSYIPQIVEKHGGVELIGKEHSKTKVWSVRNDWVIPENDTSYWCTMHRAPHLGQEHHIIGFRPRFGSVESRQRVHHLLFLRCHAPPGATEVETFGPFVGQRGQSCLSTFDSPGPMPTFRCYEQQIVWGAGGGAHFLPPHIGLPLGTVEDEFFLLQTHYDNPDRLTNARVDVSLDIFYTSELREHDAGLFSIGHSIPGLPPSILLPPNSIDHPIFGHCSPQCTRELVPPSGIKIASVFLHSHNSGRNLRLQLFRKNQELPWINSDGNYGFNFQPHRTLPEDRQILPGDHVTMRCDYDSTWTNGTVVGGFSTRQEMCAAWVYYYNKIGAVSCTSSIISEDARHRFLGVVGNVTWDTSQIEFVAQAPPHLEGLTMTQISDNHVKWTLDKREELQKFHKYEPQSAECYGIESTTLRGTGSRRPMVSYPVEIPPYRPPPAKCYSWNR